MKEILNYYAHEAPGPTLTAQQYAICDFCLDKALVWCWEREFDDGRGKGDGFISFTTHSRNFVARMKSLMEFPAAAEI